MENKIKYILITIGMILTQQIANGTLQEAITANEELGFAVYKELSDKTTGNILLSPFSIETILALTYVGAKGDTAKEMSQVLRLPTTPEETAQSFRQLTSGMTAEYDVNIQIANKVYSNSNAPLLDQYKTTAVEAFLSEIEPITFSDADAAANTINKWVESKTNNKIQNLISPTILNPYTAMVLVNTVYFRGGWDRQLREIPENERTPFHLDKEKTANIPMMTSYGVPLSYGEHSELDAQLIDYPYIDDRYVFTIILPNKVDGLAELEKKIKPEHVKSVRFNSGRVTVIIPKFKITQEIDFVPILKKFGMNKAFSNGADFSGISSVPLQIDAVVQKAFIDVNEKGTEAAAASFVKGVPLSGFIGEPVKFIADHPFLFMLRQKTTGVTLFIGRFTGI